MRHSLMVVKITIAKESAESAPMSSIDIPRDRRTSAAVLVDLGSARWNIVIVASLRASSHLDNHGTSYTLYGLLWQVSQYQHLNITELASYITRERKQDTQHAQGAHRARLVLGLC